MAFKVLTTQNLHPAASWDREFYESTFPYPGVLTGLEVTAPGGFVVSMAAGKAIVNGTGGITGTYQGSYHVISDSAQSVTITTPHATLNRIDALIIQVLDATELGTEPAQDGALFKAIPGTPRSGVTLATFVGGDIGVIPSNSLIVGYVEVDAAVGSIVTGKLGANLRLLARQRVLAHRSASQAITTATLTALIFDDIPTDYPNAGASWDSGNTTRVYARQTGHYDISAGVNFATGSATEYRLLAVRLNGVAGSYLFLDNRKPNASLGTGVSGAIENVPLNAGDYLEVMVQHDQGSNLNVGFTSLYGGYLSLKLVR